LPSAAVRDLLRLLAPFAPHVAEELWSRIGGTGSIMEAGWPTFDDAKLVSHVITVVLQVNGKHRGDIQVDRDVAESELVRLALAHPKVAPHAEGKMLKRTIYIKGRLLNLLI